MSSRSVSIRVKGKVQGVWFRASAKAKADQLHLTGFVSNTKDGSVYIESSGDEQSIASFIDWCKTGPELARVDSVEINDIPIFDLPSFEVRRV